MSTSCRKISLLRLSPSITHVDKHTLIPNLSHPHQSTTLYYKIVHGNEIKVLPFAVHERDEQRKKKNTHHSFSTSSCLTINRKDVMCCLSVNIKHFSNSFHVWHIHSEAFCSCEASKCVGGRKIPFTHFMLNNPLNLLVNIHCSAINTCN